MPVEKTIKAYADFLYEATVGTCDDLMMNVDTFISTEDLDANFFYDNELAILQEIDAEMFNCVACGWNYPISEQADDEDLICTHCSEE